MWRDLGEGPVTVEIEGRTVETGWDAQLGSVVIDGLRVDTTTSALVRPKVGEARTLPITTLPEPAGPERCRFATLSDLHIGTSSFGMLTTQRERPRPDVLHPMRAARAAIAEAVDWGAELLVFKGDLTHHGRRRDWEEVGELLDSVPVPWIAIPGNHDNHKTKSSIPLDEGLAMIGLDRVPTRHVDLPGVRIIVADALTGHHNYGDSSAIHHEICELAAETDLPAFVGLHFHLMRTPVPWFWPLGVRKTQADALLADLAAANPRSFVSSGHTHRNRRYTAGAIPITEVGSPKDYPGVWAGYAVHEGGIRQLVRRTAEPSVLSWTERTRLAVVGVWGLWSMGTLDHRSFTHDWATAL